MRYLRSYTYTAFQKKSLQANDLQGFQKSTHGRIRTPNLRIRSAVLYPVELRAHVKAIISTNVCPVIVAFVIVLPGWALLQKSLQR